MSSPAEHNADDVQIISTKYLRQIKNTAFVVDGYTFEVELDDLDEVFSQKAKEELRETPETIAQAYKELKELLAAEANLRLPDDDDFFLKFLRPCKWYAQSAFKLIKHHYRFHQHYPQIFVNLIPSNEKIVFCSNLLYPLPNRNKDGCRVLLLEGGKKWKPKEVPPDVYFRAVLLLLSVAMTEYKTQVAGVHIILNVEGLSLSQVTYLTPSFAKMVLEFLQKCLPLRLKSVHIVNQSILFNVAFAIFKPFMEEKIRKRIFFHGTNRESLMAHIDKEVLFKKYGGEMDELDDSFGTIFWQYLCNYDAMFKVFSQFGYDK